MRVVLRLVSHLTWRRHGLALVHVEALEDLVGEQLLVQLECAVLLVARELHLQAPLGLAHVLELVLAVQHVLHLFAQVLVIVRHDDVVHEQHDDHGTRAVLEHVEAGVGLAVGEVEVVHERVVEVLVPHARRLLEAVDAAQKLARLVAVAVARRLLHVDLLCELAVEERCLHVVLVQVEVELRGEGEEQSHRLVVGHRCIRLVVVDALGLAEALGDQPSLVARCLALLVGLDLVHPLALDGLPSFGEVGELPRVVLLERLHLLVHGCAPLLLVLAACGFFIGGGLVAENGEAPLVAVVAGLQQCLLVAQAK